MARSCAPKTFALRAEEGISHEQDFDPAEPETCQAVGARPTYEPCRRPPNPPMIPGT